MKYTPLDIQRREFEKAFRGVDKDEVRTFLHEVAGEWEEVLQENQRMRAEVLDLRERLQQYQEQDRIFRETLLHAQKTREDLLESANRECVLLIKEAEFRGEEITREAQQKVVEFEANLRSMKLERIRVLQEIDTLLGRGRRFLQEEAPEMFPPADVTRLLEDVFPGADSQDPSI
ncbi:DivIVA domain-containing protein [Holophaga foetida]|uniref:DivIVA domain-containing protein n=1 Tax=Holophaga foetida TaxID=35839 RepID=UPI0002471C3D|nr:DivIVA domain-containing protein [Holophaga foetida]